MLKLKSPAKLNLFLRILGKRPDGYHEIASLFQAIDIYDTLTFKLAEKDQFTCSDTSLPVDENNLVLKARDLFRKKTGQTFPLAIHLDKKIPTQAGLGGGSGNAATTLFALNQLAGVCAAPEQLATWSSAIGSDIAFFFSSGAAYCTGRGDCFRDVTLQPMQFTLYKPAFGLSTPDVYRALDLNALASKDPLQMLHSFASESPHYCNDLESAAFRLSPELASFKQKLCDQGYAVVQMSGSGSAFFCVGHPKQKGSDLISVVRSVQRRSDGWY